MNLLNRFVEPKPTWNIPKNFVEVSQFRKSQYENFDIYIKSVFKFISKISDNKIKLKRVEVSDNIKYQSINGYKTKLIQIYITRDDNDEELFLSFLVPDLIDDNFFYLTGCYYTPALYIVDYPIINRTESIKLYSLINSLSIYFRGPTGKVVFGSKNIPIHYFLQLFIDDENLMDTISSKFKLDIEVLTENATLEYFSDLFKCEPDRDAIIEKFDDFFFDDYTRRLYKACYNKNYSIKELVVSSIKNFVLDELRYNFVDLTNKRVLFLEKILEPVFTRISSFAFSYVQGMRIESMTFSETEVLKNFSTKLKHQFFYDLVNLYSGITVYKATFMDPTSDTAPKEISSVHESHFGKICPATISAQRPGETISFVPGTALDIFGRFSF